MKNSSTLRLLTLAAAFAAAALPAARAENKTPVVAFFNASPDPFLAQPIHRGDKTSAVLFALGEPDARVLPDLWVYWNCQTNHDDLNLRGLDTLVVAFAEGRVNVLKIVPHASLEPYLARAAVRRDPAHALAAK